MDKREYDDHLRRLTRAGEVTAAATTATAAGTWATRRAVQRAAAQADARAATQNQLLASQEAAAWDTNQLTREQAERTAQHEFAMWLQTPDGQAYQRWKEDAEFAADWTEARGVEWVEAWWRAVENRLGRDHLGVLAPWGGPTTPLADRRYRSVARWTCIVVALVFVVVFIHEFDEPNPDYAVVIGDGVLLLLTIGLAVTFFAWLPLRERRRKEDALRLRVATFGFEPLEGVNLPNWTPDPEAWLRAESIRKAIGEAPYSHPARSALFEIRAPLVVLDDPMYPPEVRQFIAATAAAEREEFGSASG